MAPTSTKVLVNASGTNILPSAPLMVNTGRKLTIVVLIAARIAEPTSRVARNTTSMRASAGAACLRCRSTFSVTITLMSTIVPMAIAIPASATILASTPTSFMRMKPIRTASGSVRLMTSAVRRCHTMRITTSRVTSNCWDKASPRVPRVSWIRPVRS